MKGQEGIQENPDKEEFTATIIQAEGKDAAYVILPFDVEARYHRKRVKVKATFDGVPYRGSVVGMGGSDYIIGITKDIRNQIHKTFQDQVFVTIQEDLEERVVVLSPEFREAIIASPEAERFWNTLSYSSQRRYQIYCDEAKKPETRENRRTEAIKKLENHVK